MTYGATEVAPSWLLEAKWRYQRGANKIAQGSALGELNTPRIRALKGRKDYEAIGLMDCNPIERKIKKYLQRFFTAQLTG